MSSTSANAFLIKCISTVTSSAMLTGHTFYYSNGTSKSINSPNYNSNDISAISTFPQGCDENINHDKLCFMGYSYYI